MKVLLEELVSFGLMLTTLLAFMVVGGMENLGVAISNMAVFTVGWIAYSFFRRKTSSGKLKGKTWIRNSKKLLLYSEISFAFLFVVALGKVVWETFPINLYPAFIGMLFFLIFSEEVSSVLDLKRLWVFCEDAIDRNIYRFGSYKKMVLFGILGSLAYVYVAKDMGTIEQVFLGIFWFVGMVYLYTFYISDVDIWLNFQGRRVLFKRGLKYTLEEPKHRPAPDNYKGLRRDSKEYNKYYNI